jgi:hypothetical protein
MQATHAGWGLSVSVRVALPCRSMSMANRIFGVPISDTRVSGIVAVIPMVSQYAIARIANGLELNLA